jgi:hypothetical protein
MLWNRCRRMDVTYGLPNPWGASTLEYAKAGLSSRRAPWLALYCQGSLER